ncbi:transcriptional regulator [Chryseobacterium sp. SIMBA_028]|uniref:transcriptional regulator n=1 Tax=Chryseobacterium sp. SIMBA_028 TaxID=3085771 RepID=UPI003979FEC3
MRFYLLIYFFIPFFSFTQNLHTQIIEDKIKQLKGREAENKFEEKELIALYNELYYMSKEKDHKKGMLTALTGLAVIYSNNNNPHEGLKVIGEGIILAKQLNSYIDYTSLLDCKGRALLEAGNYSDSRINFSKALKMSDLIKDKDTMNGLKTIVFNSLSRYAEILDNEISTAGYGDSLLYFGKQGYEASIKISEKFPKRKFIVGQSALLLGVAYLRKGNVVDGNKYFDIAEKLFISDQDKRPLANFYNTIGYIKFEKGNDEQALEYYNKALDLATKFHSPRLSINIYENLIEYYKKAGDTKKELYYLEKSKVLNDSLSKIHKKALIIQGKHDVNLISKQKESVSSFFIILLIVIIILIGAISFYLYRKNRAKRSIGKVDVDEEYQKKQIDEDKIALLLTLAKNNDKQFLIMFQDIFTDLHRELLKFPELTAADLEMCAYLKLNIQTKEIATYKKISIGAVDNRKYRIRKKLNLLPETDLYKWINTINPKSE